MKKKGEEQLKSKNLDFSLVKQAELGSSSHLFYIFLSLRNKAFINQFGPETVHSQSLYYTARSDGVKACDRNMSGI